MVAVEATKTITKNALQTVYDVLNHGQQKKCGHSKSQSGKQEKKNLFQAGSKHSKGSEE